MNIMKKSFKDISWNVSEETYRKDTALSYSTLARYEKTGFDGLNNLFDKIDTPALTFGSAVDSIITGGEEEFNDRFMVAEFPNTPDSIIVIVREIFKLYKDNYNSLLDIPDSYILSVSNSYSYQLNWKPETRVKVIKEKGEAYYELLFLSENKTILDTDTYKDVLNTVDALKSSPATKWYFEKDNPFVNIERLYQLKFKGELDGIPFRNMADLIIVDHDKKEVTPIDLKTSGKPEWNFYKSFIEWQYSIQARLYWRIIRQNMDKDEYFKDFTLNDYKFIVVNRKTLTPLVWEYPDTQVLGTITYNKDIVLRDPVVIGQELYNYLSNDYKTPIGIEEVNNIVEWLNKV